LFDSRSTPHCLGQSVQALIISQLCLILSSNTPDRIASKYLPSMIIPPDHYPTPINGEKALLRDG
jgi:hypothetical protein